MAYKDIRFSHRNGSPSMMRQPLNLEHSRATCLDRGPAGADSNWAVRLVVVPSPSRDPDCLATRQLPEDLEPDSRTFPVRHTLVGRFAVPGGRRRIGAALERGLAACVQEHQRVELDPSRAQRKVEPLRPPEALLVAVTMRRY